MPNAERYPFVSGDTALGEAGFRPYLPFTLLNQQLFVRASALLDTGASVNVLPYLVVCNWYLPGHKLQKYSTKS